MFFSILTLLQLYTIITYKMKVYKKGYSMTEFYYLIDTPERCSELSNILGITINPLNISEIEDRLKDGGEIFVFSNGEHPIIYDDKFTHHKITTPLDITTYLGIKLSEQNHARMVNIVVNDIIDNILKSVT